MLSKFGIEVERCEQLTLVKEHRLGEQTASPSPDLDVMGRQKEEPVGHGSYPAIQRVRETGAEVYHPPRKLAVAPLEFTITGCSRLRRSAMTCASSKLLLPALPFELQDPQASTFASIGSTPAR